MLRLSEDQLDVLCNLLPEEPPTLKGGRSRADRRKAIADTFGILDNGAKWKDIPAESGPESSAHRAFKRWV
jgi:transposase